MQDEFINDNITMSSLFLKLSVVLDLLQGYKYDDI